MNHLVIDGVDWTQKTIDHWNQNGELHPVVSTWSVDELMTLHDTIPTNMSDLIWEIVIILA